MTTTMKEKRITFTASDVFVKSVKAYALSRGQTVRSVMIECFNKVVSTDNNDFSEDEADRMLQPLIKKYAEQIENKTFKGKTLEEIKAECLVS